MEAFEEHVLLHRLVAQMTNYKLMQCSVLHRPVSSGYQRKEGLFLLKGEVVWDSFTEQ